MHRNGVGGDHAAADCEPSLGLQVLHKVSHPSAIPIEQHCVSVARLYLITWSHYPEPCLIRCAYAKTCVLLCDCRQLAQIPQMTTCTRRFSTLETCDPSSAAIQPNITTVQKATKGYAWVWNDPFPCKGHCTYLHARYGANTAIARLACRQPCLHLEICPALAVKTQELSRRRFWRSVRRTATSSIRAGEPGTAA